MSARCLFVAVLPLWGCSSSGDVSLHVDGCTEAEVRLLVFTDGAGCDSEDPSGRDGVERAVAHDTGFQARPSEVAIPVRGDDPLTVVAQCRGADGIVRGWGCAEQRGDSVTIAVEPICSSSCGRSGDCAAAAVPWTGGGGRICVQRCETCDMDAGVDAGTEDAGCLPHGWIFQTLPEERAGATAEAVVFWSDDTYVANGTGGVRAYFGPIDFMFPAGEIDLVDAVAIAAGRAQLFVASNTDLVYFIEALLNVPLIEAVSLSGGVSRDVVYADEHVFVAAGAGGLRVLDVATRQQVANQGIPGVSVAIGAASPWVVVGTDDDKLFAFDISDPEHPRQTHNVDSAAAPRALVVDDAGTVVVAEGATGFETMAIDPGDGHLSVLGGPFATHGEANGLALTFERKLFVADGAGGLTVFEFFDPAAPVELVHVQLPAGSEDAVAVEAIGVWALLAARGSGLHAIHLECLP